MALLAGALIAWVPRAQGAPAPDASPAADLIRRVLPASADSFTCTIIPSDDGRDVFEYEALPSGKIALRGNSGVSLAVAFNQYLRREARLDYDWLATGPLEARGPLPLPAAKVRHTSLAAERFFLNYCTYGYTLPWWDWGQWQRFIDWMAMNGINRPLLQAGQEAAWLKVWQSFGMTQDQVLAYFSGPAHLPWHRMANLDKWGGPLPLSYVEGQRDLQRRILGRARQLGMTPILSAFAGHVPQAMETLQPAARITQIEPGWGGMDAAYTTYYLDPKDPLFARVQARFLGAQAELYGTDHLYAADPFNEIRPPSWEPSYLASVGTAIVGSMTQADPDARWYQMAWTFYSDKQWTHDRLSAMLRAIPADRIVLLDYFCEETELYPITEDFYGRPFIWNYLGNFGGNTNLVAPLHKVAARISRALPAPGCIGVGSTLEGLNANPEVFDMVLEQPWQAGGSLDVASWVRDYAARRAGGADPAVAGAWDILASRVLTDKPAGVWGHGAILLRIPSFKEPEDTAYQSGDLVRALDLLMKASPASRASDGYRFDVVNLTRQALANLGLGVYGKMASAYQARDAAGFEKASAEFLGLGRDLDGLLGTRREFLLGPWIAQARAWGASPAEADYYEGNARQILTSWHEPGGGLTDYASRQWNGLVRVYYLPRWEKFIDLARASLSAGRPFPEKEYAEWLVGFEDGWNRSRNGDFATSPRGDPYDTCARLLLKHRAQLTNE
jgi:alpha-N-acetylglucosaminidase